MSYSKVVTKKDIKELGKKFGSIKPEEKVTAKYDAEAHINSTDMSQEELLEFLSKLPAGTPVNFVKKTGDTMTGSLYFSGANNQLVGLLINNDGENFDCGWDYGNGGAGIALRSPNFGASSQHGEFDIYARSQADEAYTKHLIGKADGTLYWGGNHIPTIVEEEISFSGDVWNYRKWSNGLVDFWGQFTFSSLTWNTYLISNLYYANFELSYPVPLADSLPNYHPILTGNVRDVGSNVGWVANLNVLSDTKFKGTIVRNGNTGVTHVEIIGKSRWK